MKMTRQKGENLSQVQQQGSVYLCIKAISNYDFLADMASEMSNFDNFDNDQIP